MSQIFTSFLSGSFRYTEKFEDIPPQTTKTLKRHYNLIYESESFEFAIWSVGFLNKNKYCIVATSQRIMIRNDRTTHDLYLKDISGLNEDFSGILSVSLGSTGVSLFSVAYKPSKELKSLVSKKLNEAVFKARNKQTEEATNETRSTPHRSHLKASSVESKTPKRWYKKKRYLIPLILLVFYIIAPKQPTEISQTTKEKSIDTGSTDIQFDEDGNRIGISEVQKENKSRTVKENNKQNEILKLEDQIKKDCTYNVFDGSFYELNQFIKLGMNDPDSFEHVNTIWVIDNDHLVVQVTYRGKNAFGALVIATNTFRVYENCDIAKVQ